MTDAEIMKALECCSANNQRCYGCPLHMDCTAGVPSRNIARAALELIDRQQEVIKVLKKKADAYDEYPIKVLVGHNSKVHSKTLEDYADFIGDVAKEGIKEFANKIVEQLKEAAIKENVPAYKWDVQVDYYLRLSKAIEIVEGGANE